VAGGDGSKRHGGRHGSRPETPRCWKEDVEGPVRFASLLAESGEGHGRKGPGDRDPPQHREDHEGARTTKRAWTIARDPNRPRTTAPLLGQRKPSGTQPRQTARPGNWHGPCPGETSRRASERDERWQGSGRNKALKGEPEECQPSETRWHGEKRIKPLRACETPRGDGAGLGTSGLESDSSRPER